MHAPRGSQAPCSTVGAVPIPSLQQQGAQLFISPFGGEEKAAGCLGRGAAAWHCSCKITCSPSSACNPQHSLSSWAGGWLLAPWALCKLLRRGCQLVFINCVHHCDAQIPTENGHCAKNRRAVVMAIFTVGTPTLRKLDQTPVTPSMSTKEPLRGKKFCLLPAWVTGVQDGAVTWPAKARGQNPTALQ